MSTITIYFQGKSYDIYQYPAKELGLKDEQEILSFSLMNLIIATHNNYVKQVRSARARRYNENEFVPNNN